MKTNRYTLVLLLALCIVACTGKEDNLDAICDTYFFEADLNGQPWEASKVTGSKDFRNGGQIKLIVETENSDVLKFRFHLPCNIKIGDNDLVFTPGFWDYGVLIFPKSGGVTVSQSGNLNVTVHDTLTRVLKGTFNLTAKSGDIVVNNGSFCMSY